MRIILAGTPATMAFAGTSSVTTAPAPTIAPSPIVTPGTTVTAAPSHTLFPVTIGQGSSSLACPVVEQRRQGAAVADERAVADGDPRDRGLQDLVGEFSTRSGTFRRLLADHNVRTHGTGI